MEPDCMLTIPEWTFAAFCLNSPWILFHPCAPVVCFAPLIWLRLAQKTDE